MAVEVEPESIDHRTLINSKNRRSLDDALAAGKIADFSSLDSTANSLTNSDKWGAERAINAGDLAELILRPPSSGLSHPERLVIRGALIVGHLDLGCGMLRPFLFQNCRFESRPNLADCKATFVGFVGCWLPGLDAARLRCDGPVWLDSSKFTGGVALEDAEIQDLSAPGISIADTETPHGFCCCGSQISHDVTLTRAQIRGTIGFRGMKVAGSLDISGARIKPDNPKQTAIGAQLLDVGGSVFARGLQTAGAVDFQGSSIGGALLMPKAKLNAPGSMALELDHAQVKLGLLAGEIEVAGQIYLHHAKIGCQLNLAQATVANPTGTAIRADHVVVDGSLLLNDNAKVRGSINLHGAKLDCTLNLYGLKVEIEGRNRFGLAADHALITGGLIAEDVSIQGGMDLTGARVVDSVILNGSHWGHATPTAPIVFDFGRFEGGITAARQFKCGSRFSLQEAYVGRRLDLTDAELGNGTGRSLIASGSHLAGGLVADRCQFRGSVDLASCSSDADLRFADAQMLGSSEQGSSRGRPRDSKHGGIWRGTSVRLSDARVAGNCDFRGAAFGQTVDLVGLHCRSVDFDSSSFSKQTSVGLLANRLESESLRIRFKEGPTGNLQLRESRIGSLTDAKDSWANLDELSLAGLHYDTLESTMSADDRLSWLAKATPEFAPGPYEQLAQSYQRAGNEKAAREVRYESVRRSHAGGILINRLWGTLQNVMIGYGFRPWRAIVWAFCTWLLGSLYFWFWSGECARTGLAGYCSINPAVDPGWDPFLYAADLLVPFVSIGQDQAWAVVGAGKLVVVAMVAIGWILVTTVAAAVARLLARR